MATTEHFISGSATTFPFTFPYLKNADVKVKIQDVPKDEGVHYNIITSPSTQVVFTTGNEPSGTDTVHIYRHTDVDSNPATFVNGNSIKASDLNNNQLINQYSNQEQHQKITSEDIHDGSIVDGDINASANINGSKLLNDSVSPTKLGSGALPTDITVASANIVNGTIVDADVNSSAAIAGTKISPDFGSQNIVTTGTVDGRNVSTDGTKLDTIETNAKDDQTAAEIKTLYESNANSNEFSDAEQTKLAGIETAATADQTNAEIKTAYEANANTNEFSDAEQTKLAGIETAATADQTASEIKTLIAGSPLDDSHLAANSVTSDKILDGAVTVPKLGTVNLADLDNVHTASPSDGQILKWIAANSRWEPSVDAGAGGATLGDGAYTDIVVSASGTIMQIATGAIVPSDLSATNGFVQRDTAPELSGNLNVGVSSIISTSTNQDINLNPNGTGYVTMVGNSSKGSGAIKLNCENNSHGVILQGPPHSAGATYTLKLPDSASSTSGRVFALGLDGDAGATTGELAFGAVANVDINSVSTASDFPIIFENSTNTLSKSSTSNSITITPNVSLNLIDNVKLQIGTGNDLAIYQDGTDSYLQNTTGTLRINNDGTDLVISTDNNIHIRTNGTEEAVKALANGAVELYFDNTPKAVTYADGLSVAGSMLCSGGIINGTSGNAHIVLDSGTSSASGLQTSYIDIKHNGTLKANISCAEVSSGEPSLDLNGAGTGAVNLYNAGSLKLYTHTNGVVSVGNLGTGDHTAAVGWTNVLYAGAAMDLQLKHDTNNSIIQNYTGDLYIENVHTGIANNVYIRAKGNEDSIRCIKDGEVALYYDGSGPKFKTNANGTETIGIATMGDVFCAGELNLMDGGGGTTNATRYIDASVGSGGSFFIRGTTGGDLNHKNFFQSKYGAETVFYHDGNVKAWTTSGGLNIYGRLEPYSASGNRWGIIPYVDTSGVMEVGSAIDFHQSDGDTSDFYPRLYPIGAHLYLNHGTGTSASRLIESYDGTVHSLKQVSNYVHMDASTGQFGITIWSSDETLKKNIVDTTYDATAAVKAFKFKDFDWKNDAPFSGSLKCGLIAQEVEATDSSCVYTLENGTKGIDETRMISISMKALQDLITKVETLETKVAALEAA